MTHWPLNVTCLSGKLFTPGPVGLYSSLVFERHVDWFLSILHFLFAVYAVRYLQSCALEITAVHRVSLLRRHIPTWASGLLTFAWVSSSQHSRAELTMPSECASYGHSFLQIKSHLFPKTILKTSGQDVSVAREPFVSLPWPGIFTYQHVNGFTRRFCNIPFSQGWL